MLKQFEGKVLILRYPSDGSLQQYDADGKVEAHGNECPWTACSGILIDNIALAPESLMIKGQRMFFGFQDGRLTVVKYTKIKNNRMPPPFQPAVDIEMKLSHPIQAEDEARLVLGKIFVLSNAELVESVSVFWRDCLARHLKYDPSQPVDREFYWQKLTDEESKNDAPNAVGDSSKMDTGEPVFHLGGDVKPPKSIHTPEPDYSEIARYESLQGNATIKVMIDKEGKVINTRVVKPLGLGLDEKSQATIMGWTFHPATRNGEPVTVELNVEVAFRVY